MFSACNSCNLHIRRSVNKPYLSKASAFRNWEYTRMYSRAVCVECVSCCRLNIKIISCDVETLKKQTHNLFGSKPGSISSADFSNTTTITTCSPSPQAGSGSVCALQPSERVPPLQREDKEKRDNKQKKRGGRRERKKKERE